MTGSVRMRVAHVGGDPGGTDAEVSALFWDKQEGRSDGWQAPRRTEGSASLSTRVPKRLASTVH